MAFRKNMEREVRHFSFAVGPRSLTDLILISQLNSVHAVTLQGSELQTGAMQMFRELSAFSTFPPAVAAFEPSSVPLTHPVYDLQWRRSSRKNLTLPRRSSRALRLVVGG